MKYIIVIFLFFTQTMFSQKFIKVKEVKLDKDLLIGNVWTMDVDDDGNFIINDQIAREIYLLNSKGKLREKLSPLKCDPGFSWRPFDVKKLTNGKILVLNSGPWGFLFNADGSCFGNLDNSFIAPAQITSQTNGLVGYNTIEFQNKYDCYLNIMDHRGIEIKRFGIFPEKYRAMITRLDRGGLFCDSENNIYHSNPTDAVIYKYNPKGELLKEIECKPGYYIGVTPVLSNNIAPFVMIKKLVETIKNETLIENIFLLDVDKILVVISHRGKFSNMVLSLNGDFIYEEKEFSTRKFKCAKNGFAYKVIQPESSDDAIPNPVIEVYKFEY